MMCRVWVVIRIIMYICYIGNKAKTDIHCFMFFVLFTILTIHGYILIIPNGFSDNLNEIEQLFFLLFLYYLHSIKIYIVYVYDMYDIN